MAQIVCIDTGTLRKDICEIDDIVEIQEDNVELSGRGYEHFSVIKVEGIKAQEIKDKFNAKLPEMQEKDNKTYWLNADGKWCELVNKPKYSFSFTDVAEADRTTLESKIALLTTKDTILDKTLEKIHLDTTNLIEEPTLNVGTLGR